jgi:5-bromo-4-chloroindolyl phosphate hydrolysis protein
VEPRDQHEREIRAARNQALFRAVNEKVKEMNDAFVSVTGTFAIACECADLECIETLKISPAEYAQVRANPRHFAVLPDHIYPEVEDVVRTSAQYVVVEKIAKAAEVAELMAEPNEA